MSILLQFLAVNRYEARAVGFLPGLPIPNEDAIHPKDHSGYRGLTSHLRGFSKDRQRLDRTNGLDNLTDDGQGEVPSST